MRKKLPRPQKIEINQSDYWGNRIYTVHYEGDRMVEFDSILGDLELSPSYFVLQGDMSDDEVIDARRHTKHYVGINRKGVKK